MFNVESGVALEVAFQILQYDKIKPAGWATVLVHGTVENRLHAFVPPSCAEWNAKFSLPTPDLRSFHMLTCPIVGGYEFISPDFLYLFVCLRRNRLHMVLSFWCKLSCCIWWVHVYIAQELSTHLAWVMADCGFWRRDTWCKQNTIETDRGNDLGKASLSAKIFFRKPVRKKSKMHQRFAER